MRLAMLTSAPRWGGGPLSYARTGVGLARRGHIVLLLSGSHELAARFQRQGTPAVAAPHALVAWRYLRRFAPDAVLADQPRDLRIAALPGLGRPGVVYRYNRAELRPRSGLADRLLAARIACCLYQSGHAFRKATAHEPWLRACPCVLVPNGFDTDGFRPDAAAGRAFRERHGIAPRAQVVLTSAELTWEKGLGEAITGLGRAAAGRRDLTYVVAGSGLIAAELERRARTERVRLLLVGWLEGEHLVAALNAADLVLHPSRHEIFPNAVGEAMACGRPVIATDVGGTPELVGREGAGLLVPPEDAVAIGAAVGALLDDPVRAARIGRAARERIASEFPLDRMVEGIESALAGAARERR